MRIDLQTAKSNCISQDLARLVSGGFVETCPLDYEVIKEVLALSCVAGFTDTTKVLETAIEEKKREIRIACAKIVKCAGPRTRVTRAITGTAMLRSALKFIGYTTVLSRTENNTVNWQNLEPVKEVTALLPWVHFNTEASPTEQLERQRRADVEAMAFGHHPEIVTADAIIDTWHREPPCEPVVDAAAASSEDHMHPIVQRAWAAVKAAQAAAVSAQAAAESARAIARNGFMVLELSPRQDVYDSPELCEQNKVRKRVGMDVQPVQTTLKKRRLFEKG
jgi:hypothetical protein